MNLCEPTLMGARNGSKTSPGPIRVINSVTHNHSGPTLHVPPRIQASPRVNYSMLAIVAFTAAACGAILFRFNPAEHAFYPQCFFHQITGLQCPGCGGLRAGHQLLHGHLLVALHLNALAVLALPLFAGFLCQEFAGRRSGIRGGRFFTSWWSWGFVGLLLAFTVLRNFSAFGFLAP